MPVEGEQAHGQRNYGANGGAGSQCARKRKRKKEGSKVCGGVMEKAARYHIYQPECRWRKRTYVWICAGVFACVILRHGGNTTFKPDHSSPFSTVFSSFIARGLQPSANAQTPETRQQLQTSVNAMKRSERESANVLDPTWRTRPTADLLWNVVEDRDFWFSLDEESEEEHETGEMAADIPVGSVDELSEQIDNELLELLDDDDLIDAAAYWGSVS